MKLVKLYEAVIREGATESCVKRFGHELFGHELGGKEKNTGLENTYVRYIEDFTDNQFGEETSPEFIGALETLKTCMKQYSDVLIPEKTRVFRGTTIPINYFIDNKLPINLKDPNPYIYKASNKIQSWSTNFEATSLFGSDDHINDIAYELDFEDYKTPEARKQMLSNLMRRKLRIGFILQYNSNPDEYIFNSKYFRILSHNTHEDELIRLDNHPIQVQAWFNDQDDSNVSDRALLFIKYINKAISEL